MGEEHFHWHPPCHFACLPADVFVSFSGNLYLVFELLERDLKSVLEKNGGKISCPVMLRSLWLQLCECVACVHEKQVCVRARWGGGAQLPRAC